MASSPPAAPPVPPPPLITRLDAALCARVLALNPRVRRLNLSGNAIECAHGAEEAAALARLGPRLEVLNLSANRLAGALPAAFGSGSARAVGAGG